MSGSFYVFLLFVLCSYIRLNQEVIEAMSIYFFNLSGGNSDFDDSCYGSHGPEYIPMSRRKTQAVTNPEYFDSDHDNLAKNFLRHSDDNRMTSRPRMDSAGWTESERSSTESEHDYYNFYNAALPDIRLNS